MTTPRFPAVDAAAWRAQVEKDLAGAVFEKTLVSRTPEGLAVQPLYWDRPDLTVPPSLRGQRVGVTLSTLEHHEAGADGADELAIVLASAVALFKQTPPAAVTVEISVGRDTFVELSKLRALRVVWGKLTTALGATCPLTVHAVCSRRTLTQRDPWVNLLRTTTQVFAAMLGGADEITPTTFDQEFGEASELGKRVAQNTLLVLEHESHLNRVADPAAGSYYLDTITDQLAREAWRRFQGLEAAGGLEKALPKLKMRFADAWAQRLEAIAKRRLPILGVSEFANPDEQLPAAPKPFAGPGHREAEAFEAVRLKADGKKPEAILVTLGTVAETRPRVGFASNFFGAGGIRTREVTADERATVACLCGTDERYAAEAAARAKALKAAGCKQVLLAGRPGANEAAFREAGIDGFIFIGCDVVSTLSDLLDVYP